jgi:hypothetical protein
MSRRVHSVLSVRMQRSVSEVLHASVLDADLLAEQPDLLL